LQDFVNTDTELIPIDFRSLK